MVKTTFGSFVAVLNSKINETDLKGPWAFTLVKKSKCQPRNS